MRRDEFVNTAVAQVPVSLVPVSLVLDPGLSPSAKLIWMILRLNDDDSPARPALLEKRSGLSRKTVLKGLAELAAAGWYSATSGGHTTPGEHADAIERARSGARVPIPIPIPGDLLDDRRVRVRGRILYGHLQLTPLFRHPAGQFTYACLSGLTSASLPTVKRAVRDLVATGWLHIAQKTQLDPVHFSLRNPIIERGQAEVDRARRRLQEAPFVGEGLMHAYLSLLVDSDDFEENATPGFLVNPWTDERMELDRFYPPAVAFEFNGPQHYGATALFSQESAAKQRGRDYMKMGICAGRGIRLVVIHPEDLALESMRQKIGHLLPLRDLNGHEQLIAFLESISRRYRLAAKRGR